MTIGVTGFNPNSMVITATDDLGDTISTSYASGLITLSGISSDATVTITIKPVDGKT